MMSDREKDPSWRPGVDVSVARLRARLMQNVHAFFSARDVLQVNTPTLGTNTVTDPNIDSIRTDAATGNALYLQTSPEYFMKRMLADGYPDIYQISKVFRASESGRQHLPEFTMVEWYRHGFSLQEMMRETVAFVGNALGWEQDAANPTYLSYVDAFQQYANLDVLHCDISAIVDALRAGRDLQRSIDNDRDAWLDLALTELVVPGFAADELTVLYHYPASQAALARLCPGDKSVADRFEVFCGALELANGFVELINANEQRARFELDRHVRKNREQYVPDADDRLLSALHHGLPPCAGVAAGFDRMLMIKSGTQNIQQVVSFSRELSDSAYSA